MIGLVMKNYNMILIEKQQKYQHYHQVKLTKEVLPSNQCQIIEQTKFAYSHIKISSEKQIK